MLGKLTMPEIERFLSKEVIGRIGCSDGQMVYVVPISYAYDGTYIYCHTHEGLKVDIMRKNPNVCFEVDQLHNMANWQSVVAHGIFEELKDEALRTDALQRLHGRILPLVSSETTHLSRDWPFDSSELYKITGVTFRIRLEEKTGRFERSPVIPQAFFSI
ncbi:pyridoxamine 5'-phosphate oxidase family protein [Flavitalea sp. BT771]|uniref:pyridoxamine 5'-phosphate oxidase family protein n=1 Tax=Flavitalea sp. BT771 TaxID=3063329 RepID=UPI0026E39370|nr:pyridoxamine 5'-phosphate oxidase family protein [Flavitalea sp. BT771]MDO6429517.1 pyridoxamine 5'-phosphate oxidase family protein [Flavitalea sp. BT771]MDV6218355.1 pyridoxamine 5'-phosphate oxidase family protein [Flavitalea sp. BT771]